MYHGNHFLIAAKEFAMWLSRTPSAQLPACRQIANYKQKWNAELHDVLPRCDAPLAGSDSRLLSDAGADDFPSESTRAKAIAKDEANDAKIRSKRDSRIANEDPWFEVAYRLQAAVDNT